MSWGERIVLRKDDIHFIKDTIVPHSAPLLSLYADVNPANPDNAGRAWLVRVKNTLRSLSLPPDLPEKVIEALEFERPEAHTCALFAGKDLLRMYTLRVDLPVVDLAHGRVDARWGEPYVFPLVYMIDEYERYGVVFVDRERWRFYDVFLGDIDERADAFLELHSDQSRKLEKRPAVRLVQGAVLRGGAEGDRFERHVEALAHRFYKRAAHLLEKLVDTAHTDWLILMGPDEDTHYFEQCLPRALRTRTAGLVPPPSNPQASAGEILKKVLPFITDNRQARELALLQELREKGMWGLSGSLQALQMGRFHLLVAPWSLGVKVLRCAGGLVVQDRSAAEAFCPGQSVQEVALSDVLPDLAAAHGARLELVQGQAEDRLIREFDRLAGLPRW
ncbi:MAG: VLRF1 family aeRF1-type release factor [Candidatus Binataceae bacterium]